MKNEITYKFHFTISKIMGIFIILGGISLGFYTKDNSVAVTLTTVGAGLLATKNLFQKK